MKKSVALAITLPVTASFIVSYALFYIAADRNYGKNKKHKMPDDMKKSMELGREKLAAYRYDKVSITSRDGLTLSGRFYPCENAVRTVIYVHGYRSNGERESSESGWMYPAHGCNLLVIDHRASGNSNGRYIGYGALEKYDLLRWIEFVNKRCGEDLPVWLVGVSMGGATVLMTSALKLPSNVKGIIDDCGYTSIEEILRHELTTGFRLPPFPFEYAASLYFRLFARYDIFAHDSSAIEAMKTCRLPVLFIHGGADNYVPTEMSRRNYKACASDHKKLLIFDGANHTCSYRSDPERYEREVFDFIAENE